MLCSCDNYETLNEVYTTECDDEFTISKENAEEIAKDLLLVKSTKAGSNRSLKNATIGKDVKSVFEVPDKANKPAYYIINYKGGGFVIIAGDKRSEPILAFSATNEFNLNSTYFPAGLVDWLYYSKETIERIREQDKEITERSKMLWANLKNGKLNVILGRSVDPDIPPDDPDDPECNPYTIEKGPFLKTT